MLRARLQLEKIDHDYETDLCFWELLAQQHRCGECLLRRYIAGGSHDQVWLAPLVVAGPVPNPNALGAVRDRGINIQVLKMQLFVGNNHIDVVLAPEAMI